MSNTLLLTAEDLMRLPLFEGESRDTVAWIASLMVVRSYKTGDCITRPGDPVTEFGVVLEGEIHFAMDEDQASVVMFALEGNPIGVLPFSRIKTALGRAWAARDTRVAGMDAVHLRELVYRAPLLAQRLVAHMTDRTRETTKVAENSNRLLALGKLAAGLAHELNNPAAAAVRSSARLRQVIMERRVHTIALRAESIPVAALDKIGELSQSIADCSSSPGTMDELERADLEADLSDWLEAKGLPGELAASLVDAGITAEQIRPIAAIVSRNAAEHGLRTLVADHEILCLSREVEEASRRISDLVQSIKSYSYMDQSPVAEVDLQAGIDVTLRMFQHQIKHGVQVVREFSPQVPKVRANGSALNQIWTNLIDNALDSMETLPPGEPRVLRVKTCVEPAAVLVEIADSGPGIPPDVQSRIFDPFFTTKPMGEGTGLGLDIVHRIIRSHKGSIRVESKPGRTVFQVRLPK